MDTSFSGFLLLEQVDSRVSQHRQVLSPMPQPHTAIVFPKGNVQNPMQAILNAPVFPFDVQEVSGIIRQAGDVEAGLPFHSVAQVTLTVNANQRLQLGPELPVARELETFLAGDSPAPAYLGPAVAFVDRARGGVGNLGEVALLGQAEEEFYLMCDFS